MRIVMMLILCAGITGCAASYAAPVANLLSQVTRTADNAYTATGVNLAGLTGQTLTLDVVCATIPS